MDKLERDNKSGAVILNDDNAYNMARKSREARKHRKEEFLVAQKKQTTLEVRLANLELRIMNIEKELQNNDNI